MSVYSKLKPIVQCFIKFIHRLMCIPKKKTLHLAGASCLGNVFIGTGKLVIGIFSMSFFTCVSAFYTYAIVIAKGYVIYGILQTQHDIAKQYTYYKRSGILLVVAGIAYITYSIKLLFYPTIDHFNQNIALSIACFTFLELGLNIRGIIIESKNKMPLFHALKIINLASSCICLVLTQTAILAYTSMNSGIQHSSSSNGIIAILMGALSTMLGLFLCIRGNQIIKGSDYKQVAKKIERFMKKTDFLYSFEPICISIDKDGKRRLIVEFICEVDEELKKKVYSEIFRKMNIVIIDKHDTIRKREAIL